eukprot:645222-Rhodomonas_salina.2
MQCADPERTMLTMKFRKRVNASACVSRLRSARESPPPSRLLHPLPDSSGQRDSSGQLDSHSQLLSAKH